MQCPCGSGKAINQCHGEDVDLNILRKQIRNHFSISNEKGPYFEHILAGENYEHNEFKGTVKLFQTITPAGVILYPILLTVGKKSLRPLSIDGLFYKEDDANIYQGIHCMITPIASCTIGMLINKKRPLTIGLNTVKCDIITAGNPFESVFGIETKGEYIALYHHTNVDAKNAILSSGILKSSKWNLQGTRELEHINYIYLTDLSRIEDSLDLAEIGMCDANTKLGVFSDTGIVEYHEVYRDNPLNRKETIKLWVKPDVLAPNPLILHDVESNIGGGKFGGFSWWEVFTPSIFRVAVNPNGYLPIKVSEKSDSIFLQTNKFYLQSEGFLAGYGKDHISMMRLWSEYSSDELKRPNGNYRPSDFGEIDSEWVEVWNRNQASLVASILEDKWRKE